MTPDDNAILTGTGPDSPLGKVMRRYWLPALLSSELEKDGAPQRVRRLGCRFAGMVPLPSAPTSTLHLHMQRHRRGQAPGAGEAGLAHQGLGIVGGYTSNFCRDCRC